MGFLRCARFNIMLFSVGVKDRRRPNSYGCVLDAMLRLEAHLWPGRYTPRMSGVPASRQLDTDARFGSSCRAPSYPNRFKSSVRQQRRNRTVPDLPYFLDFAENRSPLMSSCFITES
jgi:hypothetical protein